MRPLVKLGLFAIVLALVFVAALGVGSAVGPLDGDEPQPQHEVHPR